MLRVLNSTLNVVRVTPQIVRNISTYPEDSREQMAITDDGRAIVCWHPEKSFPYEFSKPLPEEKSENPSIFRMNDKEEVYKAFKGHKNEVQMREELMRITSTTKHRWFRRARDRKAKKTPMNRPYL